MQINFKKIVFLFYLILLSSHLMALQLGRISVLSYQDQPLNAQLSLSINNNENLDSFKFSIASKEIYKEQSIERLNIHDDIKININKTSKGSFLKLSSKVTVPDPFIDLLIQIDTPNGRNFREYTILIDPPKKIIKKIAAAEPDKNKKYDELQKENIKLKPAVKKENIKLKPAVKKEVKLKPAVKKEVKLKKVNAKAVRVKSGQTVYQIARDNKLSGITIQQMVVAIYQKNPTAFAKKNINGLIKGSKVNLPNMIDFKNLSHLNSRKILRKNNSEWNSVKKELSQKRKVVKPSKEKIKKPTDIERIRKLEDELRNTKKELQEKTEALQKSAQNKDLKSPKIKVNEVGLLKGKGEIKDGDVKTFKSSITSINKDVINEVIIKDEEPQIRPFHALLGILLLLLIILLLILARRRQKMKNPSVNTYDTFSKIQEEDMFTNLKSDIQSEGDMTSPLPQSDIEDSSLTPKQKDIHELDDEPLMKDIEDSSPTPSPNDLPQSDIEDSLPSSDESNNPDKDLNKP